MKPGTVLQNIFRLPILQTSIYQRIAFGNALIILIGAVVGTQVTHTLSDQAAHPWLILLFVVAGSTLSITTNNWIVRRSLRPLYRLSRLSLGSASGPAAIDPSILQGASSDILRLGKALNSLVLQLEERNRMLQALNERVYQVQEEERQRIARCLHDDTGQSLLTLLITLEWLEDHLDAQPADLKLRVTAARQLAADTLAELRKIIYGLRPTILDDLGLVAAVRWYARTSLEPLNMDVRIFAPEVELIISEELSTALFRICQEAVNNIVRHAQAKVVMITLNMKEDEVNLQVIDDGLGFDVSEVAELEPRLHRLGLLGIQERVKLLGGEVTITSQLRQGTRLFVCLPLHKPGGGSNG